MEMKYQLGRLYYPSGHNMIVTRLTGLVLLLNLVLSPLTGCTNPVLPPVAPAPPVTPIAPADWTPRDAQTFSHACFAPAELNSQTDAVTEVLFNYNDGPRDFRPPEGPDGYILQIIPLNGEFKSTPLNGQMTFVLFAGSALNEDGAIGTPVNIWRVEKQNLEQYWMPTHLLQGYLFQLDWGAVTPKRANYEFVVHIAYEHDNQVVNICRTLSFYEKWGTPGQ